MADGSLKRATWRRQEQELVERWSAAMERYRVAHEQLSAREQAQGRCAPDDALVLNTEAARAEIAALRKQVARLKREFMSGARY
jgi:DnaJ-domain-containing protein 1